MSYRYILFLYFYLCICPVVWGWGFTAHKKINRQAVFTLPAPLCTFYKAHVWQIIEYSINPDKRSHVLEREASYHYIDLEYYARITPLQEIPCSWAEAQKRYTKDMLTAHGILPWHIYRVKHALTAAFRKKDLSLIIKLSADIGHYIADAHVPLHTSENYDGQLTGQEGIHGLWETRLPELFLHEYDYFVGPATYIANLQQRIWETVMATHKAVDDVLRLEQQLTARFSTTGKYCFVQRGCALQRVYTEAYAYAYHTLLDGQVEKQMRASIKMIGDIWLTCWIDAGQPNLDAL